MRFSLLPLAVLLTATLISGNLRAQVAKGSVLTGLNFSAGVDDIDENNGKTENDTYTFSASPHAGYFITNHWMIGGTGSYTFSQNDELVLPTNSTTRRNSNGFTVGPEARYYFFVRQKIGIFIDGILQSGYSPTDYTYSTNSRDNYSVNQWSISNLYRPGIALFFSPLWSLEVSYGDFGYTYTYTDNRGVKSHENKFATDLTLSGLQVGVQFYPTGWNANKVKKKAE